jgi:hypothetical protein
MRNFLRPLAYGVIFILLFSLTGFRVAHPKSGLSSAAGSASSSIVVYRQANQYNVGDKVIVAMGQADLDPAIGIVRATLDETIQVQTDSLTINVSALEIRGKLFGVLPFIGIFFNLIGI